MVKIDVDTSKRDIIKVLEVKGDETIEVGSFTLNPYNIKNDPIPFYSMVFEIFQYLVGNGIEEDEIDIIGSSKDLDIKIVNALSNTLEDLYLAKEDPSNVTFHITLSSSVNADGFTISVLYKNNEILKIRYYYGYNTTYIRAAAEEHKPYTGDLIHNYYNLFKPSKIEITAGSNAFTGKNVKDEYVQDFVDDYLEDLPNVKIL